MASSRDDLRDLLDWVEGHLGGTVLRCDEIQSLWSGYGAILRVTMSPAAIVPSAIVKHVRPKSAAHHPRGWSGRTSHERKLRSYEVEQAFYSEWSPHPCEPHRTARCIATEATREGFRFLLS